MFASHSSSVFSESEEFFFIRNSGFSKFENRDARFFAVKMGGFFLHGNIILRAEHRSERKAAHKTRFCDRPCGSAAGFFCFDDEIPGVDDALVSALGAEQRERFQLCLPEYL